MNKTWRPASDRQFLTKFRTNGWAALLTLALCACEKIELLNDEEKVEKPSKTEVEETTTEDKVLLHTGEGTKESPCTVTQLIKGDWVSTHAGEEIYVIGYVVGETSGSLEKANFEPPFTIGSNILLAADHHPVRGRACLPIPLSKQVLKSTLSLVINPDLHHQCVMLKGKVSPYDSYYSNPTLSNISGIFLLGDFDIPYSAPVIWDEFLKDYE